MALHGTTSPELRVKLIFPTNSVHASHDHSIESMNLCLQSTPPDHCRLEYPAHLQIPFHDRAGGPRLAA
ncbi:hypothetical protein PtB15_12B251 [Puccinia triticina]|nr:hypothetical protein PtB15_12B251 [Puccinia triticina]